MRSSSRGHGKPGCLDTGKADMTTVTSNGEPIVCNSPSQIPESKSMRVTSLGDGGDYEIPVYSWESSDEDAEVYKVNAGAHAAGFSCEDVTRMYDDWARKGTYEQDLCPGRYNGPRYAADAVARQATDASRDLGILDVGAGSGLLGIQLAERGFHNLDALDGSSKMLEHAAKSGVYRRCIRQLFGVQDSQIQNDFYDVVAIAGGMGEGHIPCSSLSEMIRIVSPGGLVVIVMRREYLDTVEDYRDRLEPAMEQFVQKGHWERVETVRVPCYSFGKDGMVYVFRVTQKGAPDSDTS